jgi:hypothetical protein
MDINERPPFFKRWTGWYLSLLLFLLLLIGFFKWLTDNFS